MEKEHIQKITETYISFKEMEGFSAIADTNEIKKNNSKLSIALYVRGGSDDEEILDCEEAIDSWSNSSDRMHEAFAALNTMIEGGQK